MPLRQWLRKYVEKSFSSRIIVFYCMDARVKPLLYMLFYAEYRFDLCRLRMAINNLKVPNVNVSEFTAIYIYIDDRNIRICSCHHILPICYIFKNYMIYDKKKLLKTIISPRFKLDHLMSHSMS